MTGRLLDPYFNGGDLDGVVELLKKYYRHPTEVVSNDLAASHIGAVSNTLYGDRWWSMDDPGMLIP